MNKQKKKISKLEDRTREMTKYEEQKEKRTEKEWTEPEGPRGHHLADPVQPQKRKKGAEQAQAHLASFSLT